MQTNYFGSDSVDGRTWPIFPIILLAALKSIQSRISQVQTNNGQILYQSTKDRQVR